MSPDEAYYWVWSKALAPGYLDHPPMVALWIRAGTSLLGDGTLGVRLLAPIAAAFGSVLLAGAAEDLLPGRKDGPRAAAVMNATLLFAIGSVTMTPDTPLLFFWTAALWALARLVRTHDGKWWLVAGLAGGLALASKYTAFLLFPSVLVWVLAVPALRPWLRRPHPYLGVAISVAVFLPVLSWNAAHDWVSFAKQAGRTGAWDPSRALQFLGELLAGQLGLATPLIGVLMGAGIVLAAGRARQRDPAWTLLAALTIIPGLVFLQHALGDRVQANWPGILYPAAAIAAVGLGARWAKWRKPALGLGFALTGLVWVQGAAAPLALPMRVDPTLMRLGGWENLADTLKATAKTEHADFIASDNYSHAALLARLLPADVAVLGAEDRWRLFDLADGHRAIAGKTGLLVRSARRDDVPEPGNWSSITRLGMIERSRGGMPAEGFRVYRVVGHAVGQAGAAPIVVMPRPSQSVSQ